MLTIVIPSYNHEKYICECLSAASQVSVSGIKILVIDDGSTDNTPSVIKNFIDNNKDINIKLVEKKNSGLVSSLNLALELVDTEYIYICASDDVPIPLGVAKCVEEMVDKDFKFVIGGAKGFFRDHNECFDVYGVSQQVFLSLSPSERYKEIFMNYPSPLLIQSTVFRTKSIRDVNGWDCNIKLDDYSLFVKMLTSYSAFNKDFLFLHDVFVVKYRQHDKNTYRATFDLYLMVKQVVEEYAPEIYREKALLKYAAIYSISALKNKRYRDFFYIYRSFSVKSALRLPFYMVLIFLFKLKKV